MLAELVKRGYSILLPFGVNQRYDLVIETRGQFLKVQCKVGEVDFFAVYCPETDGVYLIPASEVPTTVMFLRFDPTRNKQRKRVRWARDYELPA